MLSKMKSGFGAGIIMVMAILAAEAIFGGRLDRDQFAILILFAGAWGAALPDQQGGRIR